MNSSWKRHFEMLENSLKLPIEAPTECNFNRKELPH